MPYRLPRYHLVATQDNGHVRESYHTTLDAALLEAERYRRLPAGHPQFWGVVVRDRSLGTGELEVANQRVVLSLPDPHAILVIDEYLEFGGGDARVLTEAPHGLRGGEDVVITGAGNPYYNSPWSGGFVFVISPTAFGLLSCYQGDSAGGTWALA